MSGGYPIVVPTQMGPSPMPTEVGVAACAFNGEPMVALQFATASGVQIYFVSRDQASQLIQNLTAAAAGLHLAKGGV